MSELKPPAEHAHLRWHWIVGETGAPFVAQWEQSAAASGWRNFAGWSGAKAMAACGVRYHGPCDPAAIIPDAEARQLRELCLRLSSAITALTQNHVLTVKLSPRQLTGEDIELGNTPEYQEGFCAALEMITRDYLPPLIAEHNKVVNAMAKLGART